MGKSASFESLTRIVSLIVGSHTVADLIYLVSNELSQDSGVAFQEAQSFEFCISIMLVIC